MRVELAAAGERKKLLDRRPCVLRVGEEEQVCSGPGGRYRPVVRRVGDDRERVADRDAAEAGRAKQAIGRRLERRAPAAKRPVKALFTITHDTSAAIAAPNPASSRGRRTTFTCGESSVEIAAEPSPGSAWRTNPREWRRDGGRRRGRCSPGGTGARRADRPASRGRARGRRPRAPAAARFPWRGRRERLRLGRIRGSRLDRRELAERPRRAAFLVGVEESDAHGAHPRLIAMPDRPARR